MKVIIIIPAYNEEKTIAEVIKDTLRATAFLNKKEVVVIDDGSSDGTVAVAKKAGADVVSHSKNLGLGSAFVTGVKETLERNGDIMVTIDADGQFNPAEIHNLVKPITNGEADFVSGSRFINRSPLKIPLIRLIGNKLMARFISLVCKKKFSDISCGFRAYSKEALLHLNLFGRFTYTHEVILNISFKNLKMKEIPIEVKYFSNRKSYLTKNLGNYILNCFKIIFQTVLDYMPLKVLGGIGIILFLVGLIFDFILLSIYLETGRFTPYISIGVFGLVLNFFGLSLFIIGLLSNMLNRIRQNQEKTLYYQKKQLYNKK